MPGLRRRLDERAHLAELLVAPLDELGWRKLDELLEVLLDRHSHLRRGLGGRAMRATGRLGNDLVADAEVNEIGRGQLQLRGRLGDLRGVAPQDRRAAFRGYDRVDRVLE